MHTTRFWDNLHQSRFTVKRLNRFKSLRQQKKTNTKQTNKQTNKQTKTKERKQDSQNWLRLPIPERDESLF